MCCSSYNVTIICISPESLALLIHKIDYSLTVRIEADAHLSEGQKTFHQSFRKGENSNRILFDRVCCAYHIIWGNIKSLTSV